MLLLNESKRMWLFPYVLSIFVVCGLYCFMWESPAWKTIDLMLLGVQLVILLEFLGIVLFKWTTWCRFVALVAFLLLTIYGGMSKILSKWYIIIPMFVVAELYLFWNIGGIVNCVKASPYIGKLRSSVEYGSSSYKQYATGLDTYNLSNDLGIFSRVKRRREPDWNKLKCDVNGVDMFTIENAFLGVETSEWENNIRKLSRINARLDEKNMVINSNTFIREERVLLQEIVEQASSKGVDSSELGAQKELLENAYKRGIKKGRRVLKRRL